MQYLPITDIELPYIQYTYHYLFSQYPGADATEPCSTTFIQAEENFCNLACRWESMTEVEKFGVYCFLVLSSHPHSHYSPLLYLLVNSSPWTLPLLVWLHSSSHFALPPSPPQYLCKSVSSAFPSLTMCISYLCWEEIHSKPPCNTSNTRYTKFHTGTWALHVTLIP